MSSTKWKIREVAVASMRPVSLSALVTFQPGIASATAFARAKAWSGGRGELDGCDVRVAGLLVRLHHRARVGSGSLFIELAATSGVNSMRSWRSVEMSWMGGTFEVATMNRAGSPTRSGTSAPRTARLRQPARSGRERRCGCEPDPEHDPHEDREQHEAEPRQRRQDVQVGPEWPDHQESQVGDTVGTLQSRSMAAPSWPTAF